MDIEQKYPKFRGLLSKEELLYLAKSLGFRSTVFLGNENGTKYPMPVESFIQLLDSRTYDRSLHRTFNTRDANYNVKSIKKVLEHLQHKTLSFSEIRQARLAFQLYEDDDGMGMHASAPAVLQAFHMCGKVSSPLKLSDVLKSIKTTVDIPMRLQLYEFLHILVFHSEPLEEAEEKACLRARQSSTSASRFMISASDALLTRPEKAQRYLDDCYREILFPVISVCQVKVESIRLINPQAWQTVVKHGRTEAHKLLPPLLASSSRLGVSRCGDHKRMCRDTPAHMQSSQSWGTSIRTGMQSAPIVVRETDITPAGLSSFSSKSLPSNFNPKSSPIAKEEERTSSTRTKLQRQEILSKKSNEISEEKVSMVLRNGGRSPAPSDRPAALAVTETECTNHQHKMDELKWQMLRRKSSRNQSRNYF